MTDLTGVTDLQPIEDQWTKWDYPVLLALAPWDAEDQSPAIISLDRLVGFADQDAWKAGRAFDRLGKEGYVETISSHGRGVTSHN